MRRKFMSMALTAAMVLSMAATPVFAEDTASDEGFNLNLCIASEPQTIDPALNSAVDGAIMCNHMFEGLVKWVNDGEGNAVTAPGQAEQYDKPSVLKRLKMERAIYVQKMQQNED